MKNEKITIGPVIQGKNKVLGLGDAVATVATPIARALHLGCIDPVTKQLRPESGCAKRKKDWNASVPDIRHPFSSKSTNVDYNTPTP